MDPAARVVPPRVVRRVLRETRGVRTTGMTTPHGRCCWAPRASLSSLEDIPDHDPVILVAENSDPRELRRAAYHARIHVMLDGKLDVSTVRARVEAIGQTAMDEIRAVLREDDALLPGATEIDVYTEFVATWVELRAFEPAALDETFPSVDRARADATIALDLDAPVIDVEPLEAPVSLRPTSGRTSRVSAPELRTAARNKGNLVRAMLDGDDDPAGDLAALNERLRGAVGEIDVKTLRPLVLAARSRAIPTLSTEGRLLFDLQRAAIDHERAVRVVDVLRFQRPVVRALPMTKVVRVARRVRRALNRVPKTALPRDQRQALRDALEALAHAAEERLRSELRPILASAIAGVGLVPRSAVEESAREKLIEELLDRVVARGFLGLGDLRDAISRNRLKCDDLRAQSFLYGDELLRADKLLAERPDGVYRRGEIYLRFLQRLSAIAFGTKVSRFVSTTLILPLLAAFVLLEGVQHIVGPLARKIAHVHVHLVSRPAVVGAAIVVFLLLHSATARTVARLLLRAIGTVLYAIFIAGPRWLFTRPFVIAFFTSAPFRAIGRFLASSPMLEATLDAVGRAFRNIRTRILPGLFAFLLDVMRALVDTVERVIYRVDEALLFREGEGRIALVFKGFATAIVKMLAFVVRLYVNLLIEPQVNPIKHFPVVTVSHKILLPFVPTILVALRAPLMPLGAVVANFVAGTTVFLLPGVFGFLAWELKENYRLYRAALPKELEAVAIGSHGETMSALLVPGFHSGTIPKVRVALRRASRRITRNEPFLALAIRAHTRALTDLHHIEEDIARFTRREVLALLARSPRWRGPRIDVTGVSVASNRVAITIEDLVVAFEEQSGFILGHVVEPGFARALDPDQRAVLDEAIAGMYALAGVDYVRDDIRRAVNDAPYDVCDEGLMVWPAGDFSKPEVRPMSSVPKRAPIEWEKWSTSW